MERLTAADPQVIGDFRLRARLGAGGMGQVYLATSPGGRMVAVKVIRPELTGDFEFVRRFRAEVEAARRVSGMYTAPVVAAGADDRPPWLATAFVPGPSLEGIVARYGPLPVPALWRLAAGLADALRAIHASGLVHRDLKPANALLATDGPRVIDFGIARAFTESRLTSTGSVIGTPMFMSPEQIQAKPTGPPSDVFALGSVLAFAASGAPPFSVGPEGVQAAVLYRIVHGAPDLGRVPPELRDLIQACLSKDPGWRPDVGQVAARCAAAAEALGMSPAAFWPADVARAIEAQQAATAAEIADLPTSSAAGAPPYQATAPQAGPAPWPISAPGPGTWPGAGQGAELGQTTHGRHRPAPGGISRRKLLTAAGIGGGAVVLAGVGAFFAESRSDASGSLPPGSGTSLSGTEGTGTGSDGGPTVSTAWTLPTGGDVLANPGVANGVVYTGCKDSNLYAVNAMTGKPLWTKALGWVTAAPQLVNGMVCAATNEGVFYAIHADSGAVAWRQKTEVPAIFTPTWAVNGNTVILPSATGPLTVYDVVTGAADPTTIGSAGQVSGAAIAVANGILYGIATSQILFAVDLAAGKQLWGVRLNLADGGSLVHITVSGDAIYLTDDEGTLYSMTTAHGSQNWAKTLGSSTLTAPVAGDGMIYVVDDSQTLHALTMATGKSVWTHPAVGGDFGPALSGDTVYVSTGVKVQAVNARTGTRVWTFAAPAPAGLTSTPAVAGGLVFTGSTGKNLYAIRA